MQSKALEKSIATAVVLAGGVDLLKTSAIAADSGRRAEVVEWEGLKPCCVGWVGRDSTRKGRRSLSRTFTGEQRRETGR